MASSKQYSPHLSATSNEPPRRVEAVDLCAKAEDREGRITIATEEAQAHTQDQLKRVSAPIQLLPLEVLGEVFLWMPESEARPRNYQRTISRVSLVCKGWRDAARLTSRLWRDIWVKADAPAISFEDICTWVTRAGSLATHLEISSTRCGPGLALALDVSNWQGYGNEGSLVFCTGENCLFSNPVLAKILRQAPSAWHSVTINCPAPMCIRSLAQALDDFKPEPQTDLAASSFEATRVFEIGSRHWSHWPDVEEEVFRFIPRSITTNMTMNLSTRNDFGWFELEGCWTSPIGLRVPVPLLRHLTSSTLSFGTFTDISGSSPLIPLQHCSHLENLTIDCPFSALRHPQYDPPATRFSKEVVLPHLRCLQLRQYYGGSQRGSATERHQWKDRQ